MVDIQLRDFELRFNYFGIIDLEFSSWKGSQKRNWSLKWEKREVINIGISKFNKSFVGRVYERNFFFKPKNRKLSLYFQNLTSITQSKINRYNHLNEEDLQKVEIFFKDTNYILSNGIDKIILEEDLKDKKINAKKFLFIKKIVNIKPFISNLLNVSQDKAISSNLPKLIGIKKKGLLKKHFAIDDVRSIYVSLKHLHKKGVFTLNGFTKLCNANCK